ncbi:MAG TPA: glucoamylase family protein, partial [Saprospiraceae bacterium]|nr:glucoamylase family protein [Saprospiraceae bacterium]
MSALSRWKIFDNLRRSLFPPALLGLFLFGWLLPASPWFWTFTVIGIIIPPSIFSFIWNLYKKPQDVLFINHVRTNVETLINHLIQHVWTIINLPYEAYINMDAIWRTNWRMFLSHRNLLQWDPSGMIQGPRSLVGHFKTMWISPFLGFGLFMILPVLSWSAFIIASPILVLWLLSPAIAWYISIPHVRKIANLSEQQNIYLKNLARKTWAFFENFIGPDDNWLPPDNYQENPAPKIAHRTSPTNIGLTLLSSLAAHDFGYLTSQQLITRCHHTMTSIQSLDRYKGHLFNWYDTKSLTPLYPRYVSTVDSGNLAASLLILKEGLLSLRDLPVVRMRLFDGIMDTIRVLSEKIKPPASIQKIEEELFLSFQAIPLTVASAKTFLEQLIRTTEDIRIQFNADPDSEAAWWTNALASQCSVAYNELISLTSWMDATRLPEKFNELRSDFDTIPSIRDLTKITDSFGAKINQWKDQTNTEEEIQWLETFESHIMQSQQMAIEMSTEIEHLTHQCLELSDYEYDFLFDKAQHYFSIGYNVEEHRKDAGYYDLLGSEARLGVFVAIAQGKIPQESWFALGRQLTNSGTDPVLISWSGSMFEYLMPMLIAPSYESTLLDQTHKGAVKRQIEYGKRMGLPWGISESCFNMVHANMDYQYRAFGVPGLGLKRGLGDDFVVAPYASVMALMVEPDAAYNNLSELSSEGFEGRWGFYEAMDYTSSRLNRGQTVGIVKAFMTHHQGMSFLSLAYLLLDQPMQKRFMSELQFQTSLLLLQEKIPQVTTYYSPAMDVAELPTETPNTELRIINTPNTPIPEVQLLSNGRYHVMVSNSGGGYSRWKDLAITRWREDGTCDNWGSFCYIRDLETYEYWSSTYQPT